MLFSSCGARISKPTSTERLSSSILFSTQSAISTSESIFGILKRKSYMGKERNAILRREKQRPSLVGKVEDPQTSRSRGLMNLWTVDTDTE